MPGLLAGLVAVLFVKVLYKTEDIFDSIKIHWLAKTATDGLLLGFVGMYYSGIHGVGYGVIKQILKNLGHYGIYIFIRIVTKFHVMYRYKKELVLLQGVSMSQD